MTSAIIQRCSSGGYVLQDGRQRHLPQSAWDIVCAGDRITNLSTDGSEFLIDQSLARGQRKSLLYATIGYVGRPKEHKQSSGCYVRTDLPKCSTALKTLVIDGAALRRYFYLLGQDEDSNTLYDLIGAPAEATLGELRLAWRVRNIEVTANSSGGASRARAERAFNILADPDLRHCYDAMRRDEDALPLFPYRGNGAILVEGQLADDGSVFFANTILSYKAEMTSKRVSLLLRRCEFLTDRVACRDPRRKLEVWLDGNLLAGVPWDPTWNRWKQWLKGRIKVEATFVRADTYRLQRGAWASHERRLALPSRLRVDLPEDLPADIEQARLIHALLGSHADVIKRVQSLVERETVEHTDIQRWFDELNVAPALKPELATWRPDYERYYFEQLRKRCERWFLFRDEYLFVLPHALISEVPQSGRATYIFARPVSVDAFMQQYSGITRADIRHNRNNAAAELGFVCRVIRGHRKARWLADVLKYAGEKADYAAILAG